MSKHRSQRRWRRALRGQSGAVRRQPPRVERLESRAMLAGDFIFASASVSSSGAQANDYVLVPDVSADGEFVAFVSSATNLGFAATNSRTHIYVYDRTNKTLDQVDIGLANTEANGSSGHPAISGDGRYVAFESSATNLVDADGNGELDVFVFDRQLRTTTLVSHLNGGTAPANGQSGNPDISANGLFVAFESNATNIISGDGNNDYDVFVYDMQTKKNERVSVTPSGGEARGAQIGNPPTEGPHNSNDPSISDDGRYVAFDTQAENLGNDDNHFRDVYVRDRVGHKTEKISVASSGLTNQGSFFPAISGDGNFVAFSSRASNIAGPNGGETQLYLRDRAAETTIMVSKGPDGTPGDDSSNNTNIPSLSTDGRYLGFSSEASNLTADISDPLGNRDAFLFDRTTGKIEMVSVRSEGLPGDGSSDSVSISSDGKVVAFQSYATNLLGTDTNNQPDIIVRTPDVRFIVNSTGDDPDPTPGDSIPATRNMITIDGRLVPEVTLRSAIMEANANANEDTITFKIPATDPGHDAATGVFRIRPATPLDAIKEKLTIDGLTQDGVKQATDAAPAELKIQLDGSLLPEGLTAVGLEIAADHGNFRGLNIVRFKSSGIVIRGDDNLLLQNYIGLKADGTASLDADGHSTLANGFGIRLIDATTNIIGSSSSTRGGNVISGNSLDGIRLENATSSRNSIIANVIGLDAKGQTAVGNGADGIRIDGATRTTIGYGNGPSDSNLISGNFGAGIDITGLTTADTFIQNNKIGSNVDGALVGNIGGGVLINGASGTTIGGDDPKKGNVIAYNGSTSFGSNNDAAGVRIIRGNNIPILRNQFFGNRGLGIDLGPVNVTSNFVSPATLPASQQGQDGNDLINFPVLTAYHDGTIHLTLDVDTDPKGLYRIDFYTSDDRDFTGYGEGKEFLGSTIVTDSVTQTGHIARDITGITAPDGKWISATATLLAGNSPNFTFVETSEFSQAVKRGGEAGITVITHGFQAGDNQGDSLLALAQAVVKRTGGTLMRYTLGADGATGRFDQIVSAGSNREIVILWDWAAESNERARGWSEGAGDAFFNLMVLHNYLNIAPGAINKPVHLIAHSFGSGVTSEIAERMSTYNIPLDQLTYLDAHEWDQDIFGVDTEQRAYLNGLPQPIPFPGAGSGLNYGSTVWRGTAFADSYYEVRGGVGNPIGFLIPRGRPVPGAYNRFLDDELPANPSQYTGTDSDHSFVWNDFYTSTINGEGGLPPTRPAELIKPDYGTTGYAFSRVLGGQNERPAPVFSGTDQDQRFVPGPLQGSTDPAIVGARFAPQWNPLTILNGNFESPGDDHQRVSIGDLPEGLVIGKGAPVNIVPSWSHHGGGGDGSVVSHANASPQFGEYFLELGAGTTVILPVEGESDPILRDVGTRRTHNQLIIPQGHTHLNLVFDLRRTPGAGDDSLKVTFTVGGVDTVLGTLPIDAGDGQTFERRALPIPDTLFGKDGLLTLEVIGGGANGLDANVGIDNLRFDETTTGVSGFKFVDKNGNGQRDAGEVGGGSFSIYADLNHNNAKDVDEPYAITQSDGSYTLALDPGTYDIREEPVQGWERTSPNPDPVTVVTDQIVPGVDFGNFEFMHISGIKFKDVNGNGVRDPGDDVIPGWKVRLFNDQMQLVNEVTTGPDGRYTFDNVDAGDPTHPIPYYNLFEDEPEGWSPTRRPQPSITVESGFHRDDLDFGNFANMTVLGHKWEDNNGNGVHDEGEPGVPGWRIDLDINDDGAIDATTHTDDDGFYKFEDVGLTLAQVQHANRTFRVLEESRDGWINESAPGPQDIASGEIYGNMDFVNFHTMKVKGTKFEDLDGDGIKDPDEPGVGGFVIELDIDGDGISDYFDTTAPDGTYEIKGIGPRPDHTPGDFTVKEVLLPGWTLQRPGPNGFIGLIDSGAEYHDADFLNFRNMTIGGTKYEDQNGNGQRDAGEPGLGGWTIVLDLGDDSPVRTEVTDADGNYLFTDVPPRADFSAGTFTLHEVGQAGYFQTAPEFNLYHGEFVSGQDNRTFDFGNFKTVALGGVKFADLNGDGVRQETEPGLKDWAILLDLGSDGTIDRATTTDSDGRYGFFPIGPGEHTIIEVQKEGWEQTAPDPAPFDEAPYVITTQSGEDRTGLDFGNQPVGAAVIAGTKFHDADHDAIRDIGEPGLPGWLIYLDINGDGILNNAVPAHNNTLDEQTLEPATLTDDKGNYAIVVTTGTYLVREVGQFGWAQTFPGGSSGAHPAIVPDPPQSVFPLDFGNFEPRTIDGLKFEDRNGNGQRDEGEPPLEGWTISLRDTTGAVIDHKVTGADGKYKFTGMPAGIYAITEELRDGFALTTTPPQPVDLTNPANVHGVNFGNFELMTVAGIKFEDRDGDGQFDSGETGLSGWTIELDIDQDGAADRTAVTNAQGEYRFDDVAPRANHSAGAFTVREVPRDGYAQTLPTPVPPGAYEHTIFSGRSTLDNIFGNFRLASVAGVVFLDRDQSGSQSGAEPGIRNRTVYVDLNNNGVLDEDDEPSDKTDSQGGYLIEGLKPGTYALREVLPAHFDQTSPAAGAAQSVSVTTSGQSITGVDFGNFQTGEDILLGNGHALRVRLDDENGESTTITLTNATGTLRIIGDDTSITEDEKLTVVTGASLQILALTLDGTQAKTTFTVATKGGDGQIDLGDITVNGSLASITAKGATLRGDLTVTGTAKTITLKGVADDHLIQIGAGATAKDAVTLSLGRVADTDINSLTPIKSLTVIEWKNTDDDTDTITAPWLGAVASKGATGIAPGDFEAGATLSGAGLAPSAATLGAVKVKAALAGAWDVTGNAKGITAGSIAGAFNAAITGALGAVKIAGDAGGVLSALSLKSLSVGGSLTDAALTFQQPVDPKLKALGALTVKGDVLGSVIRSAGSIGGVTVGALVDSTLFAGVKLATVTLPAAAADFDTLAATLASLTVKGNPATPGAPSFVNSLVAAGIVGKVKVATVELDNDGTPFGLTADKIASLSGLGQSATKFDEQIVLNFGDLVIRVL